MKKYAHLKIEEFKEHEKTKNLRRIAILWESLQSLIKLSPLESDVRKTLFQRFQKPSGKVTTLINLIQEDALEEGDLKLALRAQKLKLNTYHAPELFKAS